MTSKVLELNDILIPDKMAVKITDTWLHWDMLRISKKTDWEEVRRYVYATDTTQTTNSQLPWKNKTTIPKLCQIRDNLYVNYNIVMFPKRKSIFWEADEKDANSIQKRDSIESYMSWVISQPSFKHEMDKIILDYIDFGNCFATVEWVDQRTEQTDKTQTGYVGPALRRISPLDIVMNPTAENFESSPKIIRSIISMGELKAHLEALSNDDNRVEYEELYKYLKDVRAKVTSFEGDLSDRDRLYQMDGFTSFREYLRSDFVELLTFYGDLYDPLNDELQKNRVITVVDRHRLINNKPNPSFFATPPIFHVPWRKRQDNLWGMGPLDNLVGMQYRIDHVENMKADIFDLVTYPVQKIKGFIEDYTWEPGAKIFLGEEGDVDMVVPDVQALQANFEIDALEKKMEEMAGAPREAMGFRSPGEKTKYEVSRLENASSRMFQHKTKQLEEHGEEKYLNAMLELARRNFPGSMTIKVFNDFDVATFQNLTIEDITGIGRIKPVASRNFAEQAELVQNLTNLTNSNLWPVIQPHWSGKKLAKIMANMLDLADLEVEQDWVGVAEQAEGQKFAQALNEQVQTEGSTATGMRGDFDLSAAQGLGQPTPEQMQQAMGQQ